LGRSPTAKKKRKEKNTTGESPDHRSLSNVQQRITYPEVNFELEKATWPDTNRMKKKKEN